MFSWPTLHLNYQYSIQFTMMNSSSMNWMALLQGYNFLLFSLSISVQGYMAAASNYGLNYLFGLAYFLVYFM
jgi:hypothetical protein